MKSWVSLLCVCIPAALSQPAMIAPDRLEFQKSERIAFVGGSLAERMNLYGNFEALLQTRFAEKELVVRNFGRPADEVGLRQRPNDYAKLDDPLEVFGPETFFCFFGFNESFAGPVGVEKFKNDYEKFMAECAKKYGKDGKTRFVLVSPIAFEHPTDPLLPDGKAENENLKLYTQAIADVARKNGLTSVDVFTPTLKRFNEAPGLQYTINGAHVNEAGDREVAQFLDAALFAGKNPAKPGSTRFDQLREAVNDKSWVHLQDYRMLNGWYVYGGRRTFDTETFPLEYKKIRNMAAVRDRYVWDIAQGRTVSSAPDDSETGELFTPPTGLGRHYPRSEPKEWRRGIEGDGTRAGLRGEPVRGREDVPRAGQAGADQLRQQRPTLGGVHADVPAVEAWRSESERPPPHLRGHQ
jgi:GDSL-like Lipase/Acylhydrolase family